LIRQVIRPKSNQVMIDLPKDYVDKNIELIINVIDEKNGLISLAGSLNKYADKSKLRLENKAWDLYIMDKYK